MDNNQVEILLIEDNPNDAELTIRALKKNNIFNSLVHLENGELALDFLFGRGVYAERDINQKPVVILLDLKMPKVDGIEVLEAIKSNELTRKIPVIILTSSREFPDIERCYTLGVNSYIVKPVDFENFMAAVKQLGMYWLLLNQSSQ